jgi:alanine dehydrogenase
MTSGWRNSGGSRQSPEILPSQVAEATLALTNATLPYVLALANLGFEAAIAADPALARGVNVHAGAVTYQPVAEAFGLEHRSLVESA